jgi:hypothetical protein
LISLCFFVPCRPRFACRPGTNQAKSLDIALNRCVVDPFMVIGADVCNRAPRGGVLSTPSPAGGRALSSQRQTSSVQLRRRARRDSAKLLASWHGSHRPCSLLASSWPPSAKGITWSRCVTSTTLPCALRLALNTQRLTAEQRLTQRLQAPAGDAPGGGGLLGPDLTLVLAAAAIAITHHDTATRCGAGLECCNRHQSSPLTKMPDMVRSIHAGAGRQEYQ